MQIVALAFFVAAVAVWWYYAVRQKKQQMALAAKQATRKPYHCVEVHPGIPACGAAQRIGSTRFLSDEAPILPVSGCTMAKCTCRYIHHDDRREDDRRNPYGRWSNAPPAIVGERRSRIDRRKSQESAFGTSMAR
jgi:hypothetical protein